MTSSELQFCQLPVYAMTIFITLTQHDDNDQGHHDGDKFHDEEAQVASGAVVILTKSGKCDKTCF